MSALAEIEGAPSERVVRIERTKRFVVLDLREVWAYRELLYFLTWRDVKVRYKQTLLGAAWAVIQPIASMVIFTIIFGHLAGIKGVRGVPYALFVFAGLLPWTYFASSLAQSSLSVAGNASLVTKVYFPRLIMPLASITVPIIDFLMSFLVLVALFAGYGTTPNWRAVFLPAFLALAFLTALGVGFWLAALNVRYRDVPYVIPFLTQIWLFASPVIYPVALVPGGWRWLLGVNPMAGVIDGFRWALFGRGGIDVGVLAIGCAATAAMVLSGLVYFKHVERRFADVM